MQASLGVEAFPEQLVGGCACACVEQLADLVLHSEFVGVFVCVCAKVVLRVVCVCAYSYIEVLCVLRVHVCIKACSEVYVCMYSFLRRGCRETCTCIHVYQAHIFVRNTA